MRKLFLFVCCATTMSFFAAAQSSGKKWNLGIGLEGGLPTGDAKSAYNYTGGVTVRFSYQAGPGWATFTTGAIVFGPKSFSGVDTKAALQIPFKAGYRYNLAPHFYVHGELGYSSFRYYYDDGNGLASTSTGGFTYAPAIGTDWGKFDASVRYEGISVSGGTISYLGLRLGLTF